MPAPSIFLRNGGGHQAQMPMFLGRIFFVAPAASYSIGGQSYSASDNNDGLVPERALRTVSQAMTNCAANRGDIICLLPGDHTATASIAASKAGVRITGMPGLTGRQNGSDTSLTISATDQIINVTAADVEIAHLRLIPITTQAAIDYSAAAHRLHVHDCYFDMETPAANAGTIGLDALGAAQGILVQNCQFVSDGAQGPGIDITATINAVVDSCRFLGTAGTWAAAISCGAATSGAFINWCEFNTFGTAMTVGIDGTGATIARGVAVNYCTFGNLVTVGIDNFDANEATLNECYKMGVGATDGGTKLTAIT